MDRKTAEREAARIVREAKQFAQENSGFPDEYVWFLVGVLQNEIATLLERMTDDETPFHKREVGS